MMSTPGLLDTSTNRDCSGDSDYYKLLGCDENSTPEQIAAEFKQLARQHHPDKERNQELKDKAEQFFMRLEAAKAVLLDREMRSKYDQWRSGGFRAAISFSNWLAIQSRVHSSMHWAAPQKKVPSLPQPEATTSSHPPPGGEEGSHESAKRPKIDSPIDEQKLSPLQQFRKGKVNKASEKA